MGSGIRLVYTSGAALIGEGNMRAFLTGERVNSESSSL
jgi:hypothetical protein